MQGFIASDSVPVSLRVRQRILDTEDEAGSAPVVSLERAGKRLAESRPELLDVVVVVLSPDPQRALSVLGELRKVTREHIIAVGPSSNAQLILNALQTGVNNYVGEEQGVLEAQLPPILEKILEGKGRRQLPPPRGYLIAVLGPSGGSGATTLAANLGVLLANEKKSDILLLDMRLGTSDLASLLDLKPTHTLADLCQNAAQLDPDMFGRSLVRHSSGVRLLAPPRSFADIPLVTDEGIIQVLTLGRALFPIVLVDVDNSLNEEQHHALRDADEVLLVTRLEFACLRNVQRSMDHLERIGVPRARIRLIVNRYGQPKEVDASRAEDALGVKVSHYIPEDARTVNRANNNGVPVVLDAPTATVSKKLTQLATSINVNRDRNAPASQPGGPLRAR